MGTAFRKKQRPRTRGPSPQPSRTLSWIGDACSFSTSRPPRRHDSSADKECVLQSQNALPKCLILGAENLNLHLQLRLLHVKDDIGLVEVLSLISLIARITLHVSQSASQPHHFHSELIFSERKSIGVTWDIVNKGTLPLPSHP